jgi:pentatricopeptide repeat protein
VKREETKDELFHLIGKSVDLARKYFDSIPTHAVTSVMARQLISAYATAQRYEEAIELMQKMAKVDKLEIETDLINQTILTCVRQRDMEQAKRMFSIMIEAGKRPNKTTFNMLIDGYYRTEQFEEGYAMLQKMSEYDLQPDTKTISSIIHGLGLSKKVKLAEEVYSRALPHFGLEPCDSTTGAMIGVYIKNNMSDKARIFFDKLPREQRFVSGYNSLLQMYFKNGNEKHATELFTQMKREGVIPDAFTLTILVSGYTSLKQYDKAVSSFSFLSSVDIGLLNLPTKNAILKSYCKSGNVTRAADLFSLMRKRDSITYTTMIDGYFKQGEIEYGEATFQAMLADGISPTGFEINAMITGYIRLGRIEQAKELLESMIKYNVKPTDSSYNTLIKYYVDNQMFDLGEDLLWRMVEQKIVPTNFTWSILMSAYYKTNNKERLDIVKQVFEKEGISVDIQTKWFK